MATSMWPELAAEVLVTLWKKGPMAPTTQTVWQGVADAYGMPRPEQENCVRGTSPLTDGQRVGKIVRCLKVAQTEAEQFCFQYKIDEKKEISCQFCDRGVVLIPPYPRGEIPALLGTCGHVGHATCVYGPLADHLPPGLCVRCPLPGEGVAESWEGSVWSSNDEEEEHDCFFRQG